MAYSEKKNRSSKVIGFMNDQPRKYRGSFVNIFGRGSASPHHDHNLSLNFGSTQENVQHA